MTLVARKARAKQRGRFSSYNVVRKSVTVRDSFNKERVLMSINTREIPTELVGVTEAGLSKVPLIAIAFKLAWEVNVDLAGQDPVEHC